MKTNDSLFKHVVRDNNKIIDIQDIIRYSYDRLECNIFMCTIYRIQLVRFMIWIPGEINNVNDQVEAINDLVHNMQPDSISSVSEHDSNDDDFVISKKKLSSDSSELKFDICYVPQQYGELESSSDDQDEDETIYEVDLADDVASFVTVSSLNPDHLCDEDGDDTKDIHNVDTISRRNDELKYNLNSSPTLPPDKPTIIYKGKVVKPIIESDCEGNFSNSDYIVTDSEEESIVNIGKLDKNTDLKTVNNETAHVSTVAEVGILNSGFEVLEGRRLEIYDVIQTEQSGDSPKRIELAINDEVKKVSESEPHSSVSNKSILQIEEKVNINGEKDSASSINQTIHDKSIELLEQTPADIVSPSIDRCETVKEKSDGPALSSVEEDSREKKCKGKSMVICGIIFLLSSHLFV